VSLRSSGSALTGIGRQPSRIIIVRSTVICDAFHCLPHAVQKYEEIVPYIRKAVFPHFFQLYIQLFPLQVYIHFANMAMGRIAETSGYQAGHPCFRI
jgi:hypothetical protein